MGGGRLSQQGPLAPRRYSPEAICRGRPERAVGDLVREAMKSSPREESQPCHAATCALLGSHHEQSAADHDDGRLSQKSSAPPMWPGAI